MTDRAPWQLEVFRVSVRKRVKWAWVESALRAAGHPRGECLDLGCGVGTLSALLEARGGRWTFLEPDEAAAAEARTILRGPVRVATLESAGFPPAHFDLVTAFDVLEHVPDLDALLHDISKVLRPGGVFLATTPAAEPVTYVWRAAGAWFFGITKEAHGHVVEGFSGSELERRLTEAGFVVRAVTSFSHFFTEAVELLYNGAYHLRNARRQRTQGYNRALSPASRADVDRHPSALAALRVLAPFLRGISRLDRVVMVGPGYEYGVVAEAAPTSHG